MPMKALWESLVEPNSKTAEVPMAIISDHRCGVEKRSTAEEGKLMGMKEDFRGGATPIMLAVLAGRSDVVTALIPLVDVNATLSDTQTSVLHLAAEYGQAACIAAVFDDKSTWAFNSPLNDQGRTPLHLAALFGQLEAAKALVEKGRVSVGLKDSQGRTPLHLAASGNCFDVDERMVSYLVGKGAVVDAKDKSLQTPLMLAAACGNAFEIGELVRLGARVNADNGATTPLMIAAVSGKSESVEKLIALGAPIEAEDATGMTALHWAANCNNIINNVASIVALVAKGASVHVADRNGRTPLHVAAEKGNFETINVLVTAGSNLEVVDGRSRVPLQSFEAFGKQQCSSEDAAKIRSALGRLGFFKRHGLI
eukprot:GILJ01028697.1.p1 GENE.GILJ01028697.1~~GILJ01028697.1.p1  ORF type:complete len:415 (+),score=64.59 GILJ01028697.1:144-1247(+)